MDEMESEVSNDTQLHGLPEAVPLDLNEMTQLIDRMNPDWLRPWLMSNKEQISSVFIDNCTGTEMETDPHQVIVEILTKLLGHGQLFMVEHLFYRIQNPIALRQISTLLKPTIQSSDLVQSLKFRIFEHVHKHPQFESFWVIIDQPFRVLEMLLMNQMLADFNAIVASVRSLFHNEICQYCVAYKYFTDLDSFTLQHSTHRYTMSCLNRLLIFYADHSLDLQQRRTSFSLSINESLGFYLPSQPPKKCEWVADDAVSNCQCCKLVKFTATTRRHHCRRCGRVVCRKCSLHKRKIPNIYKNSAVRMCNDCVRWSEAFPKIGKRFSLNDTDDVNVQLRNKADHFWMLTGNTCDDTEIRLQFGYPETPNVSLCLAILQSHSEDIEGGQYLWRQCKRLEEFIYTSCRSNVGDVDYKGLANSIKSMAWSGKIRSGTTHEWDKVIAKADIIIKVFCLGVTNLLPVNTMHQLRDKILLLNTEESFPLAFDISITSGLSICGLMQMWGHKYIRLGKHNLARDKVMHCHNRLMPPAVVDQLINTITDGGVSFELDQIISRPKVSPRFIIEILKLIEDVYDVDWEKESLFYLFNCGSHEDIVHFLVKCQRYEVAFRYVLNQEVQYETFLNAIVLNSACKLSELQMVEKMRRIDTSMAKWQPYIQNLCALYDKKNLLTNLYSIQVALGDNIRAAITCVKLFCNNCSNYKCLVVHLPYLANAREHLKQELQVLDSAKSTIGSPLKMILPKEQIQFYLNMLEVQEKVTLFLAKHENDECISNLLEIGTKITPNKLDTPFTMFDNKQLRYLLFLLVACDPVDGYQLVLAVMACFTGLDQYRKHEFIAVTFARWPCYSIDQIIDFADEVRRHQSIQTTDNLILTAVKTICECRKDVDRHALEQLIKCIHHVPTRILAFIYSNHLKSAYLLSVKIKSQKYLRKISNQALHTNEIRIKRLCDKHLEKYKIIDT